MKTEKPTILVVDDSLSIRRFLCSAIGDTKYNLEEAEDGQQALDILSENKDIKAVILDIHMPKVTGIDVLEKISSDDSNISKNIPILILTTDANPKLIKRAKELGAKGWMVKPPNAQKINSFVDILVKRGND